MAKNIKISVCITVLNEEKTIDALLKSLVNQSLKPFEIVVVDGGSSDKTSEIIRHFAKKNNFIKFISEKGSIAHCRNVSIEISKGEIVALTDAGCVPHGDWLEKITQPFNIYKTELLVAGFYNMPYTNSFQKAASVYLGTPKENFDKEKFIPSARSVAFSKSVWDRIGGFDEKLEKGGEDTKFFYDCVKQNVKIFRVEQAIVNWIEIEKLDLNSFSKKIYTYAKGDGQANIWWHPSKQLSSHNIKISLVYLRYFAFFTLLVLSVISALSPAFLLVVLLFYLLWPIYKWKDVVENWGGKLWLPVVQIVSDIEVMRGFFAGTISKKRL